MLWKSNFHFFYLKNWICSMSRHHVKPNINTLLTRNLSFDSDVRQWMITMHCLWAKSNNRACGQFDRDLTCFFCCCFCFMFFFCIRLFTCTVHMLFHSLFTFSIVQIKQWVLKMWIVINKRHFVIFLDNCTHKSVKPRKNGKWGFI